ATDSGRTPADSSRTTADPAGTATGPGRRAHAGTDVSRDGPTTRAVPLTRVGPVDSTPAPRRPGGTP
ncbi:hypothetical protein, partial [Streptomyces europaeiscabiei]|uniref:hypothetical protein n=1 Tax=Streptomyces europaeiscabiei TaxID=146819 RepID=UPI001F2A8A5F